MLDEAGVLGGVKPGSEGDGLAGERECFGIGAGGDENHVPIQGSVDTRLNGGLVLGNSDDGSGIDHDGDLIAGNQLSIIGGEFQDIIPCCRKAGYGILCGDVDKGDRARPAHLLPRSWTPSRAGQADRRR